MPFRAPDDEEPFGFSMNGIDFEVHCKLVHRRVKGTCLFNKVPSMCVYAVSETGRLLTVATDVIATEVY